MGADKATMNFRGRPMWERQLNTLRELGPAKIFVSARTKPDWLPDDVELLLDDVPSRGPLGGIAKALAAMETTHLIALAVDMPFMKAGELRRLLQLPTEGCGVVPVIGDCAEPVAAIYPATAAIDFQAALAGPDLSLQSVVRKLADLGKIRLWAVPDTDANFYRNVNEPDDLKEGRFQTAL